MLLFRMKIGIVAGNGTGEVSVDQYHHYKVSAVQSEISKL